MVWIENHAIPRQYVEDVVKARKSDGEWAYGRDYNLKTGIWQGGRYSMNLNQLYERVGGTFGRVYKDNHVGKTGKF